MKTAVGSIALAAFAFCTIGAGAAVVAGLSQATLQTPVDAPKTVIIDEKV